MGREIAGWVGLGLEGSDPLRVGLTRGLGQINPKIAKNVNKMSFSMQKSF